MQGEGEAKSTVELLPRVTICNSNSNTRQLHKYGHDYTVSVICQTRHMYMYDC